MTLAPVSGPVPSSLVILPSEPFIDRKLEEICRMDPCADGGIDAISVDQDAVRIGSGVSNLLGTGYEEVHALDEGLCVHFMDGTVSREWRLTARNLDNCLRLRIPFTGMADYESLGSRVSDLGLRCTFIIQPSGASMTGVYHAGVAYRYCMINVSQNFLEQRLGLTADELPRAILSRWANGEIALGNIVLERPVLATAARFFGLPSRGGWRRIEVHAIALDLLRHILAAWTDTPTGSKTRIRLRPSERDQLTWLRKIADERSPLPISIPEAVAITGLNKNKIHVGFHQFFGMSLREYCFDLRMQKARSLLLERNDITIADIAEAVGFSEPTNFTNTFRKHFGALPSSVRVAGRS